MALRCGTIKIFYPQLDRVPKYFLAAIDSPPTTMAKLPQMFLDSLDRYKFRQRNLTKQWKVPIVHSILGMF